MSSSSVCQGLQTCLEARIMEPRALRLKFTAPESNFSQSISSSPLSQENDTTTTTIFKTNEDGHMKTEKDEGTGGGAWSFLQCLTDTTKKTNDDNEKVYVHPLVKRSSSTLSEKSLQMCTESLGSETGSSLVSDSSDDEMITTISSNEQTRESNLVKKRTDRSLLCFPPPLTSISNSNSVQVMRPHREGGRLVLQAVTVSSSPAYFQAERIDGRLRLCLVKDLDPSPSEDDDHQEDEDEDQNEEEEDEEEVFDEEAYEEGEKEKDLEELGLENFQRPNSRCNEDGRGGGDRVIWKPFCVAT